MSKTKINPNRQSISLNELKRKNSYDRQVNKQETYSDQNQRKYLYKRQFSICEHNLQMFQMCVNLLETRI